MPTLNFPSSPSLNDEYTFEGKVWSYNGSGWGLLTRASAAGVLVKTATSEFEAARVVIDSPSVVADWSTPGFVKLNVVGGGQSATVPADFKDSVACATTGSIVLSGEQTIDGVLTSASRVLVKDQNTPSANGIYVSAAGAWSRATDADESSEVTPGMLVLAEAGTVNADQVFILTTNGTITLGTTALTFVAVSPPATNSFFVIKTVTGTTYTNVLLDAGKRLRCTNASAKTFTIAPQTGAGGVAAAVNTEFEILNAGSGLLTIAPGSGVTLTGALTVAQYGCVKAKKIANPNTWEITNQPSFGKQTIYIPASAMLSAITSGPPSAHVETATNDINFMVLDFDATADEHAHFNIAFPKSWNLSTVTFQPIWTTLATNTNGVAWGLQAIALSDNDVGDTAWGSPVVVTDDAQGAANEILVSAESGAVTIGGTPALGDIVFFRIFRDVSDANDDMAEDARLIGVKLFFHTSVPTDA